MNIDSEYILAIVIAGATALGAVVLEVILKVAKRRLRPPEDGSPPTAKFLVLDAIDGPAVLMLILAGFTASGSLAATSWQIEQGIDTDLALVFRRVGTVLVIAVGAHLSSRIVSLLLDWYVRYVAPSTGTNLDDQLVPSIKRLMPIVIYSIAGLWALSVFDIAISPLLATLGIGGIAIALAAQPTLSNYFAGTYVISEGEISPGDFIEIEGGPSGFVEDISWRSTKLRSRFNNLIIIPNSMMSENMITNYSRPALAMNVVVTGGVSYASDLQQVEDILLEVATKVVVESDAAVTEVEPWIGFDNFGDSNIDFWVFIQATDRLGSYELQSELMKQIHRRFNEEGVVINYPIRHLVADDPQGEEAAPSLPREIVDMVRRNDG